jgi:two-component system phosphate regulon sensor histidine kinase PhoR
LEFLLHNEFEKRNIKTDFEYGIYDCTNEKMVYGNYVSLGQGKDQQTKKEFPLLSSQGYYFGVQFPNQNAQLLNQMGIWTFSSIVLIVVLLFFGYTLFVILKQKRLSEIQRDFINNMTHEFKTPLATISVSTEVLKDPSIIHNPERLNNYTAIIEKESIRLRHHVDRVLQLASSTKDDLTLNKEKIDIHKLIEEVILDFELQIHSKNGEFIKHFSATNSFVNGDMLHLQNAFYNLFDNAIKYATEKPTITIKTEHTKKRISIAITDNGIGIAKENQSRVFENFYRVPTGNVHNVKGFGIGLSYVKTIVDSHQGTITLKSELEKGSTFTITFPTV